jgi:hypothetical protein
MEGPKNRYQGYFAYLIAFWPNFWPEGFWLGHKGSAQKRAKKAWPKTF